MKCRQLNALPAELSEVPPTPGAPEQGHFSEVHSSLHCQAGSAQQSCVMLPLLQNRLFPEKLRSPAPRRSQSLRGSPLFSHWLWRAGAGLWRAGGLWGQSPSPAELLGFSSTESVFGPHTTVPRGIVCFLVRVRTAVQK